jgi:membrane protein implicated in regulation of membrane protease activity
MEILMGLPWFWIWLILAAVLFIAEMLTLTFYMLPFAIGAAVAAVTSMIAPGSVVLQWVLFIVVSVVALALLRPVARRVTRDNAEKSGVDRLVGNTALVIDGKAPAGMFRVRVDRDEWNAERVGGGVCAVGSNVIVESVDGTRLKVREV